MRKKLILATTVMALALGGQAAIAAEPTSGNEVISGEVTAIDKETGRVTVRSSDGKLHEFTASKETLAELKPGDHLEARKRPGT